MDYATFLAHKKRIHYGDGIQHAALPPKLFDWQAAMTKWALRKGRAALFADCGLGKSPMQLAWASAIPGRVLILAPLVVGEQTVGEGVKFGVEVHYAKNMDEAARHQVVITNYERIDAFDPDEFSGIVLDESSILKAFDGKTRTKLINLFQRTPYRLCCTATPSPNDIAELANHAEFLGLMTRAEFLATWFVHDDAGWRMKKHAVQPFYRWLASWALAVRKPSDLGYSDEGFTLPALRIHERIIETDNLGVTLFPELGLKGIGGRMIARKASLDGRIESVLELIVKSVYDKRGEESLLPRMAPSEQGMGEAIPRQPEKQGPPPSVGQAPISDEQGIQGQSDSAGEGLRHSQSNGQKKTRTKKTRHHAGAVQRDGVSTEQEVRDLSTEDSTVGGPLPQNQEDTRAALLRLQFRYRDLQGQHAETSGGNFLPKWLIWCGLNDEQEALAEALGCLCVSVIGSDSAADKSSKILRWIHDQNIPAMLTKVRIAGFGMNFQNCHHMAFCGIGDSYEQYYQAIRRCWRFGQKHAVHAHVVVSRAESAVVENVKRKEAAADQLASDLIEHMRDFEREELSA